MRGKASRLIALLGMALLVPVADLAAQQPVPSAPGTSSESTNQSGQPLIATPRSPISSSALVSPYHYISPFAAWFAGNVNASSSSELSSYYQSPARTRLLEVPEMFGDYRRGGPFVALTPMTGLVPTLTAEIPYGSTFSGLKVAENNHALPADRFWFSYQHFNDALHVSTDDRFGLTPTSRSLELDRFVIASEILLDDGATSFEMRMPFASRVSNSEIVGMGMDATAYSIRGGKVGNLSLILKRLLYGDDAFAFSYGLGLELPTGNSGDITYASNEVSLDSGAVHLVPFLAMTTRTDRWFGHLFSQVDVASHGDPLRLSLDGVSPLMDAGRVNQPPLLSIDVGHGYWIIPKSTDGFGLAVTSELHYTVPMGDNDSFSVVGALGTADINTPMTARYEVLHSTTGVQIDLPGEWSIRPAVVLPLLSKKKVFDAEYVLQVNRSF